MRHRVEEAEHQPNKFRYPLDQFRVLENNPDDDDPFDYDDILVLIRHDGEKGIYVSSGKNWKGGHIPFEEFLKKFREAFLEERG